MTQPETHGNPTCVICEEEITTATNPDLDHVCGDCGSPYHIGGCGDASFCISCAEEEGDDE